MWGFVLFCILTVFLAIYLSSRLNRQKPIQYVIETPEETVHQYNEHVDVVAEIPKIPETFNITPVPLLDINIKRDLIQLTEGCHFLADIGMVCPLIVEGDDYKIDNFNNQTAEIQNEVTELLDHEWGNTELSYHNNYISKNWQTADVMYVLIDKKNKDTLVGCVAIDRHKFYPFVSHLYIKKECRGYGYAKKLLELCEIYGSKLKFSEIKLWCVKSLVPFYSRIGWSVESVDEKHIYVMSKKTI